MTSSPHLQTPQTQLPPLPQPDLNWALFLDFDGTLAPLARHPDAVSVQPSVITSLFGLSEALDGAVAVISGRPVAQIDRFLAPLKIATAGKHGLETRLPGGDVTAPAEPPAGLAQVKERLAQSVKEDPRLLLEDKVHTVALHYRQAPERAEECDQLVKDSLPADNHDLQVLHGKMVIEVKPAGSDKGTAIERLMAAPAFAGRTPVFAGDDVTDEDGFKSVNKMGGISIRVGAPAETAAAYSLPGVPEFLDWLDRAKHVLAAKREGKTTT